MKNEKTVKFFIYIYTLFSVFQGPIYAAEIIVDKNKNPNVNIDKAPNGKVDFININNPNKNGISHNVFTEFNVDKNGVILNNGKDFTTSQLGGIIYGNPNFQNGGREATLILNEVSGINRSKIEGFTEITGKKADYILANPNGIYVNGAGFINMGRVTFTTGVPVIDNFGKLTSFNVNDGTVTVGSLGLDTRNVSMFDIISRTAELYGSIYGGENVNVILGRNEYDYTTGKVTAKTDDGSEKPKLALDGKALGSLYAGRIFLQSTEKGVGVNSEGEMLAGMGDLELDVNGDLILKNAQAKNNIRVKSDNLTAKEKIAAEKDITLNSKEILNEGNIVSNNNLEISAKTLNNKKNIVSGKVLINSEKTENEGKIQGNEVLSIKSENIYNSGNMLGTTTKIESDESINTGTIYGESTLNITSNLNNSGNIQSKKNIDIAGNVVNNNIIASGEKISFKSEKIENSKILSSSDINLTAETFSNSGEVTGEALNVNSSSGENSGILYGKNSAVFDIKNEFKNDNLVQSLGDITLNSDKITNTGNMFSGNNLTVNSSELLNKGQIVSDNNGKYNIDNIINENLIQGNELELKNVKNSENLLSKGNIYAENLENSKNVSALKGITLNNVVNTVDGKIVSDKNILIKTSLENDGILSAKNNIDSENISNKGKMLADGNLTLVSLNKNSGVIQGNNINISNENVFDNNSGEIKIFNDNSALKIKAEEIKNKDGIIGSQGILDIEVDKDLNLDEGKYIGNKELNIKAVNLVSENNFENAGNINLALTGDLKNNNKFVTGGNLNINAQNIETNGSIGSVGITSITLKGFLKNLGEMIFGKGENSIKAKRIENDGFIISNDNLNININNLKNSGQIAGAGNLNITAGNNVTNNENSLIFSGKDMILTAEKNIINKKAEIYSTRNLEIAAKNKIQNTVGSIEALGDINLEADIVNNVGELTGSYTKKIVSGSQSSIDVTKLDLSKVDKDLQDGLNRASRKSKRWQGEKFLDTAEEGVSNFVSNTSNIKSAGNIDIKAKNILNKEGNITANNNINIIADTLNNDRDYREIDVKLNFRRNYKYKKRTHKTGHSKIYASTTAKQRLYGDKTTNITAGGNINITAEKLGNGEYTTGTSVITTKEGITHGIVFNNQNNIKKDGTIQVEDFTKIPEGDKGLFKVNQDLADIEAKVEGRKEPKFSYLVETNVKFIDKGYYLGSEYFFSRINFNPEKDIRLLGDSFYETTIVNKAIFESTGRRYLNGAATDKEQMQILYDNSVKAMEDFNLSIGVALTKDQINNLKNDIIWYVEEEVNGIPILVPKVYLSKETLASLDDIKGNQINAGKELNISALAVNNTGSLLGEKGVTITTDNLINESMRNGAYADISGESITIFAKNDIINRGGNIGADKNLILNSENGSILNETKVVINRNTHRDIITDITGIGNMSGDNVKISVGNSFTNAGGQVQANKDVNISAGKDINLTSVETVTRKETGSSRNYTVNEKVQNIESTISGENINLQAGKNLNAIGSDVTAGNNLDIKAGENVNIAASVDNETYEKHKSSSGFFSSKESVDVKYNETIKGSNFISGNDMNISAGNNVNVAGSNVVSENNLNLEAGNNVVISSALEGSSQYHENVKTGFLGLSGRQQKDKEIDYTNVKSYVGAGENINIKADKNVTVLASDVEARNDVNINAGKDVNIIAGDDIRIKESEKHKHKTSLFGGVKDLNFEIGMKTEISKNKNSTLDTKVTGSNISSRGDVNISSGKDIKIEASNIEGKNTNLKAENELNVTGRDELHVSKIKNEKGEIKITAGVNLGGIKDTVDSVVNMVESAKDIPKAGGVIKDLASGKDLNESLEGKEDSINALNTWLNGPADGGVSAGIYAGAEAVKDKSEVKVKDTIGSTIISENDVNLKTDKGDMNFTGTDIYAGNDININSGKDINISSGKEKSENKTSSQSVNGQINIVTGQISGGISVSEGESKSEINKNSNFYAENNIDISGKDMTVKGGNIKGEHIKIDVDNLHVESLQDKSSSSDKSVNVHGSSDNKNNTSTGAGMTSGKYDKEWVENQTSIIGRENSHITVEGNTHLEGGLLGGKDTTLNTGSLSFNDIKDHEKGTNIGLSENISKGQKDENSNDYTSQLDYSATDREQITHATVGAGTITVGGKEENPEGLNRDESKAQEITKDVTVDNINMKYDSERRDWNEVKDIMTEHGAELDKALNIVYDKLGKEYKHNISKDFEKVWNELELIVGKDLKQDLIGLLPTERNNGGIFEQPITKAEAELKTHSMTVVGQNPDGSKIVDVIVKTADSEIIKRGIFANGILNYSDTVGVSGANQSLSPEIRDALNNGKTVEFTTYTDPSHGILGDLVEAIVDLTGYYTDGKIMTGNAKKLANEIRKNPDILTDYTAHSKGTAITANAIIDIINSGDGAILKGKKIRFHGSPLQLNKMEKLSKKYGFEFEHVDNIKDPVTNIIGGNKPNSGNEGHSTSGNDSSKGYSKYQKYNKEEKIYKTNIDKKDFHNVDEIRKVNGKNTNSKVSQKLKEIKNKIFNKKEGEK
ncbi:hemagglutinin repeat-containing protein [Fusobacterium mortiferum]|uniref:two-partner secretion domain-containing protein n=1 Tax=Fusobacterium mortiferum TaxID=850 RepID=UPI0022E56CEB|nr:hemagglutinin repeat-containing protein [Fusobacterium mortiferum]